MKCDRARQNLHDTPGVVARGLLGLHLLRCPACRAEANQVRALDAALGDLPRFTPPPELLPTLLAKAQVRPRKEIRPMKRLAFVAAFLIAIGLVIGGVLIKPDRPDGRSLLISAAQAMGELDTIHMRGHGSKATPEGTRISEDSFEEWCSPEGSRMNFYDPEGNLRHAWVLNVGLGMAWYYDRDMPWFHQGVVTVYYATPEEVAASVARRPERYLEPELELAQEEEWGNAVTVRQEQRDGRTLTIVQVEVRDSSGDTILTKEFEIRPATGYLVSSRAYGADSDGRPLLGFRDVLDHGAPIPSSLFEFTPPAGVIEIEGYVNRHPSGIVLPNAYFMTGYELECTEAWHASAFASSGSTRPQSAIDGDKRTRWTGRGEHHLQEPGMWFQLNFDEPVSASRITVHHGEDYGLGPFEPPSESAEEVPRTTGGGMSSGPSYAIGTDSPRGLQVSVTSNGRTWEDVPTGPAAGDRPACALFGAPRQITGVRLILTDSSDEAPWSITEIRLYE